MYDAPAAKWRHSLAQRQGPHHARFWCGGVEGVSAGKPETGKITNPEGMTLRYDISPRHQTTISGRLLGFGHRSVETKEAIHASNFESLMDTLIDVDQAEAPSPFLSGDIGPN